MIERERIIEIVASAAGVGAMLAMLYFIGANHAEEVNDHQVLSPTGGELVIYGMIAFIVLMAVVGFVLIHTVTVPEAEKDAESA